MFVYLSPASPGPMAAHPKNPSARSGWASLKKIKPPSLFMLSLPATDTLYGKRPSTQRSHICSILYKYDTRAIHLRALKISVITDININQKDTPMEENKKKALAAALSQIERQFGK